MKLFLHQSLTVLFCTFVLFLQPIATKAARSKTLTSVTCTNTYLPVALAPNESKLYQVYGELCGQLPLDKRTVQVLVPGLTYGRTYWDFPHHSERYSYVNALTEAGYATFSIDRIGTGNSSRPPADRVDVQSNGYVLNQINQALKNGEIEDVKFKRIINVGHSFGSLVVINAVSQYGGVDGVILTGFLHNLKQDFLSDLTNSIYLAQLDPRFSQKNLPDGYQTTLPGVRGRLFYNQSNTDPQVIALDEATKETSTDGELATAVEAILSDTSRLIEVPVLVAIGQYDYPFCNGDICNNPENVAAFEAPFFSPEAQLQTYVLQNAGHNINLQFNAPLWFEKAHQWSDRFVGVSSKTVPETTLEFGFLTLAQLIEEYVLWLSDDLFSEND